MGLALLVNEVGVMGRLDRVRGCPDTLTVVWVLTVKGKDGIWEASMEAVTCEFR